MATDGNQTYVLFLYKALLDQELRKDNTVIGFNAGDGVRSFTLTASIHSIITTSNIGVPGVYIFRVDQESVMQPPISISNG